MYTSLHMRESKAFDLVSRSVKANMASFCNKSHGANNNKLFWRESYWFSRWWNFKYVLFSPLPGDMIQFDLSICFKWVGEPTTNYNIVLFEKYVTTWNHLKIRKKKKYSQMHPNLGGGNSNMFYFHPYLGKISNLTSIFFQMGWFNHQPETLSIFLPKTQSSRPKKRKRTKTTVGDLRDQPMTSRTPWSQLDLQENGTKYMKFDDWNR